MSSCSCRGVASIIGATQPDKTYLVMHIDNPQGLVAHEKGAGVASLAMTLVPEYVENQIYSTVKQQLQDQFAQKGSTVSVDIVQTPPQGSKPASDLLGGVLLGVLGSATVFGLIKLLSKARK